MTDPTALSDGIAQEMRDYYEAEKPLRWWQRRRKWDSSIADNLMLGLLSIARQRIPEFRERGDAGKGR